MRTPNPEDVQAFAALRPAGGFPVILADPPWEYDTWSQKGAGKGASNHYDTMSVEEISAVPVQMLAAHDCALFTWVTWPHQAFWQRVLKAWGFTYKALAWEWIKYNPRTGKYAFGGGYGTRKNLEPCLLATRGNPQLRKGWQANLLDDGHEPEGVRSVRDFIQWSPHDCVRSPRREHSRKPPEQYDRIETLFSGPYVELFARETRPGWSAWGNEVGKFDAEVSA